MTKLGPMQLLYFFLIVLLASSLPAWSQDNDHGGGRKGSNPHYKVLHNFQGNPDANGNFDPEGIRGLASDGDVAFLPWFARQTPSSSVNGQYTFLNSFAGTPPICGQ